MIIKIPDDIQAYEGKAYGNFTGRQLICLLIGGVVTFALYVPTYFLTTDVTIAAALALIVAIPIMACGFIKKDGVYLEKQIKAKWEKSHKYKLKRPFVMGNFYEDIIKLEKEDLLLHEEETIQDTNTSNVEVKKNRTRKHSLRTHKR